jgi:hypothetical protein
MGEKQPFAGWERDAEGNLKLTPVFSIDVQGSRDAGIVVFKMDMIADNRHLELIKAGKMKPVGLQLSLTPAAARRFASQLDVVADLVEGRAPSRRDG